MLRMLVAAVALLSAFLAWGAEVAGVRLDDKARVEARELVLNGAGLRKKFVFSVYVIGLYLPEKASDAAAVLQMPGPKRTELHMLRTVDADDFTEALTEGLRANHSDAEYKALEPRVQMLNGIMAEIKEAKKGATIALDWTGMTTRVLVDGKPAGKPIAGEDFYRALLRIWIGDQPVQDNLKKALLGGG